MSLRLKEKYVNTPKTPLPQEGISSFIRKIFELLEEGAHSDIVSWSDDGNLLVIKKIEAFTDTILPMCFRHNKMNSFIRQLNMYNFRKKRNSGSFHIYYNQYFKKGRPDLLVYIKRKTSSAFSEPSNPAYVEYDHGLGSSDHTELQLEFENRALKRSNEKAVEKIRCLEARIQELKRQNEVLAKKISLRERQETDLESAVYKCLNTGNHAPVVESASQSDSSSNLESYLAIFGDEPRNNLSYDSQKLLRADSLPESNSYSFQTSVLRKRTFSTPFEYFDPFLEDPRKILCKEAAYQTHEDVIRAQIDDFPVFSQDLFNDTSKMDF